MKTEDDALVARCRNGELREFGRLYDKYFERIYKFVFYKTLHRETAEDLTSRTFFKALDKIDSFDGRKGAFSSWLLKIAQNTVYDFYRAGKSEAGLEQAANVPASADIARAVEAKEKLRQVKKLMEVLSGEQKEIVILRVWNELSFKEIAQLTGKSEAACKMAFSRIIAKLRAETIAVLLVGLSLIS